MKNLIKTANYLEVKYALFGLGDKPFDSDIETLEAIKEKSEGGMFTSADPNAIGASEANVVNNILDKASALGFSYDSGNWAQAFSALVGGPMKPGTSRLNVPDAQRVLLGLVEELIAFFQLKNDES